MPPRANGWGVTPILDEPDRRRATPVSNAGLTLRNWIDGSLATQEVVEGRSHGPGEAKSPSTAARPKTDGRPWATPCRSRPPVGESEVTVVGISALTDADSLDPERHGERVVVVDSRGRRRGTPNGRTCWCDFDEPVVTPTAARIVVRDATPDTFTVSSGDDFQRRGHRIRRRVRRHLRPILQGFAFLALFVCSIVIYNTYAVVVAQRRRELALIRAVAATPRQVWLSLCVEGLIVGIARQRPGRARRRRSDLGDAGAARSIRRSVSAESSPSVTPGTVMLGNDRRHDRVARRRSAAGTPRCPHRTGRGHARGHGGGRGALPSSVDVRRDSRRPRRGRAGGNLPTGWIVGALGCHFVIGLFVAGPALAVSCPRIARPILRPMGMAGRCRPRTSNGTPDEQRRPPMPWSSACCWSRW